MSWFFMMAVALASQFESLPKLNIDANRVSVSGLSAGAFAAIQMHLSYADIIHGVGVVAGGVYWCSEGQLSKGLSECMFNSGSVSIDKKVEYAKKQQGLGNLASPNYLKNFNLYIYASPKDIIVKKEGAPKIVDFYRSFTTSFSYKLESNIASAHGFPTVSEGNRCDQMASPWIQACGRNIALEMINFLEGKTYSEGKMDRGQLFTFNQGKYSGANTFLMPEGYVYIPERCRNGMQKCGLHMALHGCKQNTDDVGDQFETRTGIADAAEAAGMVVIFPQAARDQSANPNACWDWTGYSSKDFANTHGPQTSALRAMIRDVSGF